MPDPFLIHTQNVCKFCDVKIFLLGGTWWHRSDYSPRKCDYNMGHIEMPPFAEPKFTEGSPEHLKAMKFA